MTTPVAPRKRPSKWSLRHSSLISTHPMVEPESPTPQPRRRASISQTMDNFRFPPRMSSLDSKTRNSNVPRYAAPPPRLELNSSSPPSFDVDLSSPFSTESTSPSSVVSPMTKITSNTKRPRMRAPPPVYAHSLPQDPVLTKCRALQETLDAFTLAVESYPANILKLDSPSVLGVRSLNSLDERHVTALCKVFPSAAHTQLSSLAALLIVDSYLGKVIAENQVRKTQLSTLDELELHPATTGSHLRPTSYSTILLAKRSNEALNRIPDKARATLGIHLPHKTEIQDLEYALRTRAQPVQVGIGVCGRKLVEALTGGAVRQGEAMEVLWRSLRVLVESIESFDD